MATEPVERHSRRTRWFHAAVYLVTLPLIFTGWWLLVGREGAPSLLESALGTPDTTIHVWLGRGLAGLAVAACVFGRGGVTTFVRETFRRDPGDGRWWRRWPAAAVSGRFARHEGYFDPGQRAANVAIVGGLLVLTVGGLVMTTVHGGPAYVWLHRVHRWAALAVTVALTGHVLIAIGVLPGYRGVWKAMHRGGRLPEDVARSIWPGWTERHGAPTGSSDTASAGPTR